MIFIYPSDQIAADATIPSPQTHPKNSPAEITQPAESESDVTQLNEHTSGEQTIEDPAVTMATPTYRNAADIQAAEIDVPVEWNVGDTILDLYEVKQIHDSGGMGLVYRVHHKGWNMDLAVKSPRAELLMKPGAAENFTRECETWIDLGLHPHIVSCHYVRNLGGVPRVFAEYVEGGSLKDWIETKKLYEGGKDKALERILDIAIQFVWGLQYAHEKGLVHQDVKPANVMMTADGTAKVTDFGLAKARSTTEDSDSGDAQQSILVSTGGMTPAYCSPEQANHQPVSSKTDIWSWAVSVLEMFTGEVTWMGGQIAAEALESFLDMEPMEEDLPNMPEALVDLLRHCFQQNLEDRPKNIQEISQKLKHTYEETTGQDYPRSEPKPAELLADGLNNKALSILDLGKREKAEEFFEQALQTDPHHPEATYNRGLLRWRSGQTTDEQLIKQLEEVRTSHEADWRDEYLLARVHIERGDAESALKLLEEASIYAPDDKSIQSALKMAKEDLGKGVQCKLTLQEHKASVNSMAIAANSHVGISGGYDTTVRLWDLETGRCLKVLNEGVTSVAISTDGKFAILGGFMSPNVFLWNLATGECTKIPTSHTDYVTSVAITPDGKLGLSASRDKTVCLLDLHSHRCLHVLQGHSSWVNSVSISNDGSLGLSGSDNIIRLWDLKNNKCIWNLEGHQKSVLAVALSANGHRGLSGSSDNTVCYWNLETGKCIRTLKGHLNAVQSVAISADSHFGLSGSRDDTVRFLELNTGKCIRVLEGQKRRIILLPETPFVAISPNGRMGLVSRNTAIQVWDFENGITSDFSIAVPRSFEEVRQHADNIRKIISKSNDLLKNSRQKDAWDEIAKARTIPGYERNKDLRNISQKICLFGKRTTFRNAWCAKTFENYTQSVSSVAFSTDGQYALSGSWNGHVKLWNLENGKCLYSLVKHTNLIESVAISADGYYGISGSSDNTICLWDLKAGKFIKLLDGHTRNICSVGISEDGRLGISGSYDHTTRLWDLKTGKCIRIFDCHKQLVLSVAISPSGNYGISGTSDGKLYLWDLKTGQCLQILNVHSRHFICTAISSDSRWVMSGGDDETVAVWDLSSGKKTKVFNHHGTIRSVAFSPDSRFGFSGSTDKTVRLWDLETGKCLKVFDSNDHAVVSVNMSADGRWMFFGSGPTEFYYDINVNKNGSILKWEFDWDYQFPNWADWNIGAQIYLDKFLTLHCQCGEDGISRVGKPSWNEEDFNKLIRDLQYRGYGWLKPEGVRKKLEEMTANWKGPPLLRFDEQITEQTQAKVVSIPSKPNLAVGSPPNTATNRVPQQPVTPSAKAAISHAEAKLVIEQRLRRIDTRSEGFNDQLKKIIDDLITQMGPKGDNKLFNKRLKQLMGMAKILRLWRRKDVAEEIKDIVNDIIKLYS